MRVWNLNSNNWATISHNPSDNCRPQIHALWFFYFQVIAGGNYDVDCFVTDPQSNVLYNERKRQYDTFSHVTSMKGVYKVCFSNEFSSFSHKMVYLEFRAGEEDPLMPEMARTTALTQVSLEHIYDCYVALYLTYLNQGFSK